ncbi:MAG: RNA methyltransferase [Erysipelotrichaceae bacterium]|nr:RNA methyltransferase [Erysipelotrichaceae bacterium]
MKKYITSSSNKLIKDLIKLKNNKEERFLIEGKDLLDLAYLNNLLEMVITTEDDDEFNNVETIIVPKFILEKLSNNKSVQPYIGVSRLPKVSSKLGDKLVYLDGVQDPGNVGTIIRTALAFSYDGVILSKDSASLTNSKVIQSTKGALFSIPLSNQVSLKELKEQGYMIIVTSLEDSINYLKTPKFDKFVLVLGNEGQGVKKENIELADTVVRIEMGNIDSLNVAVAGGILMNHYRG